MAKVAAFVLVVAFVLFVSACSVLGDNSPGIYEQIEKSGQEVKEAIKQASPTSTGNTPEDSKSTTTSWGQWFENKLENLGVISEKPQPGPSAGDAQAPAPNAGRAYAPTAEDLA
ncbi:hypothetical protein P3X46_020877 [Hevea brasiliensis]|uniref:Secreted protein n=1 Tax=Hevea brasiliensis TaxID=3981 RepID=A0ABQ9LDQ4_HEVBR|nr:uncharacterized protein LOC110655410 [Hevea brasiliensis]KAJ9166081.1 hypothetical protein P3X46_020877 [Hevea brasiliensis]